MVIAARRDKQRFGHKRYNVEAQYLVIEPLRIGEIANTQVHVTEFGADRSKWGVHSLVTIFNLREEAVEINWIEGHLNLSIDPCPLRAGPIPIEFQAIGIRIVEIERLTDEVI